MKKLDSLVIPHLVFFENNIFLFVSHVFIWKQRHLWILLIFWSSIKKGNQVCFRFDHFGLKLNFLMHYILDTSKNTIKVSSWTYVYNCRICEWKSGLWIRVIWSKSVRSIASFSVYNMLSWIPLGLLHRAAYQPFWLDVTVLM